MWYYFTTMNEAKNLIRTETHPLKVSFNEVGNISALITTDQNGNWHSIGDLPAYIAFYDSGKVSLMQWCKHGNIHRENDLPAVVRLSEDSQLIKNARWAIDGQLHRDPDLPAVIGINEKSGDVEMLYYYKNGEYFSVPGRPYYIWIDEKGETFDEDGEEITVDFSKVGLELPRPPPVIIPPFLKLG